MSFKRNHLSEKKIYSYLKTNNIKNIYIYDTIDSTNDQAKLDISLGNHEDALYIANEQKKGRGRHGKKFYSPKDSGLYMTLKIKSDIKLENSLFITTLVAIATTKALKKFTDKNIEIKWVNDLYLNGKKICGILTEVITNPETLIVKNFIIGIGINLNTSNFPDDLSNIATSLFEKNISKNKLAAYICNSIYEMLSQNDSKKMINEYKKYSMVIGKEIKYIKNNIEYFSLVKDINDQGNLIVINKAGNEIVLNSGEISIVV